MLKAFKMNSKYQLGTTDYFVVVLSLLIAMAIGIKFGKMRQETSTNYLMGSKNMPMLPVILSITVTMMSAITMMGTPAEVYQYGIAIILMPVGNIVGTVLARVVFVPVYFQCNVNTTYQFLQLRYGSCIRYVVSGLFIIQMILYMSVSLYAPVLALNAVTDLSIEVSILVIGLVCTSYCALGGLKAVFWTDAFQAVLMISCIMAVNIQGVYEAGGFAEVFKKSQDGGRFDNLNFKIDFGKRYDVWNSFFRGLAFGASFYGTSQIEVQRMLSLGSSKRAKTALALSILPSTMNFVMSILAGLIFYAIFNSCDPIASKDVTRYDQVFPFFVVSRFSDFPGLTGLCIAGIFSGSLSTISSALNSLATVTVVDFIKPLSTPNKHKDHAVVYIAKGLSFAYGLIGIGIAFVLTSVGGLIPIAVIIVSIAEGPMLAVFLVAVLTRKASEKCAIFGLLFGVLLSGWIGFGSAFSGYKHPALPMGTGGCSPPSRMNATADICLNDCLATMRPLSSRDTDVFPLYKMSFMWLSVFGFLLTTALILISALFTGWKDVIPLESKCLSPVSRLWFKAEHSNVKTNSEILEMTRM